MKTNSVSDHFEGGGGIGSALGGYLLQIDETGQTCDQPVTGLKSLYQGGKLLHHLPCLRQDQRQSQRRQPTEHDEKSHQDQGETQAPAHPAGLEP